MEDKTFPVEKTNQEWEERLSPSQFHVLREHGTERAGTSPLNQEKRAGHVLLRRLRPSAVYRVRRSSRVARAGRASLPARPCRRDHARIAACS